MLRRAQILRYLRLRYLGWAALALAFAASVFTLYLDSRVRSEFEGRRFALPARIYARPLELQDRKSTRLNSSHLVISYAVFCLKKKKQRSRTNYLYVTSHSSLSHR